MKSLDMHFTSDFIIGPSFCEGIRASIRDCQGPCKKRWDGVLFFPARLSVLFSQVTPRGGLYISFSWTTYVSKDGMRMIAIHGGAAVNPYTPKKE